MKYSLLVCAYNAEKYLNECLDSLVNQTIDKSKYEIVVVNDGSTDDTEKIANSYKGVRVVNQENKGLSEARNTAIKNSGGEWIIFIDADDYISKDLLQTIENANPMGPNLIVYKEVKEEEAEKKDKKRQSNKMDDSIVSRAVHRSLFVSYSFPHKYKYAIEDWDFYVHNIKKLNILDIREKEGAFYFYRYNEDSLSKSSKVYRSRLEHAIYIFENEELRKNNLGENIIGHYWPHLYMMAILWFPDLLDRVKVIKYKTKTPLSVKLQYFIVKMKIFNKLIRRMQEKIDQ